MAFSGLLGQDKVKSRLSEELRSGIGHAYLFTGPEGIGKHSFGREFAKAMLCFNPTEDGGCGKCNSCTYFDAGTHPDFISLEAAKGKRNIKIDDLRENCLSSINIGSQISHRKVYLINADKLENVAQNALLKSIEEPPEDISFVFTCSDDSKILPTVLSRVETLKFTPNTDDEVRRALLKFIEENDIDTDVKTMEFCVRFSEGIIGKALKIIGDEELTELKKQTLDLLLGINKRSYTEILYNDYSLFDKNKDRTDDILLLLTWFIGDLVFLSKNPDTDRVVNNDCRERLSEFVSSNSELKTDNFIKAATVINTLSHRIKANVNFESCVCDALMQLKKELTK